MKKYILILIVILIGFSMAYISYAETRPLLPYEGVFRHSPWTEAGDVRYHITIHKPYKEWSTWPGKERMHRGKEPHGAFMTTYVNGEALESISRKKGMEDLSIIVNVNYTEDRRLKEVYVMYRVVGYNPEGGNWFWAKYDSHFHILDDGKLKGCLSCHSRMKDNDYIFSGEVLQK